MIVSPIIREYPKCNDGMAAGTEAQSVSLDQYQAK